MMHLTNHCVLELQGLPMLSGLLQQPVSQNLRQLAKRLGFGVSMRRAQASSTAQRWDGVPVDLPDW
jgi:hypothetical protein